MYGVEWSSGRLIENEGIDEKWMYNESASERTRSPIDKFFVGINDLFLIPLACAM